MTSEAEQWRSQFAITNKHTYLDNASLGPLPAVAIEAMSASLKAHGEHASLVFGNLIEEVTACRTEFAELVGAQADEVSLVASTGAGFNVIANGLSWGMGDNVVFPDIEFPSIALPLLQLEKRGLEIRKVPCPNGRVSEADLIDACDSRTRMVAASWVQFSSGHRLNLVQLGEECRKRKILFVVDGMQGVGVLQLKLNELPVDALVTQSFKWLLAPQGVGWLYVRREIMDEINPTETGQRSVQHQDSYVLNEINLKTDAGRFECGMPNLHGVVGAKASLKLLKKVGVRYIEESVLGLVQTLFVQLCKRNYILKSINSNELPNSGILSFRSKNIASQELVNHLRKAGIVASVRENYIRISPHFYNSDDDIKVFLDALP